jgi:hypothetical protein
LFSTTVDPTLVTVDVGAKGFPYITSPTETDEDVTKEFGDSYVFIVAVIDDMYWEYPK